MPIIGSSSSVSTYEQSPEVQARWGAVVKRFQGLAPGAKRTVRLRLKRVTQKENVPTQYGLKTRLYNVFDIVELGTGKARLDTTELEVMKATGNTLHENSGLYPIFLALMDRIPTDEERRAFDTDTLIGRECEAKLSMGNPNTNKPNDNGGYYWNVDDFSAIEREDEDEDTTPAVRAEDVAEVEKTAVNVAPNADDDDVPPPF